MNTMNEAIYRPGLEGIIAGETSISSIADGLRYRGYPIEQLAQYSTFEEVAYLVLHGELPTRAQLDFFTGQLRQAMELPQEIVSTLRDIPADVPMMDVLRTGASLLGHWDPQAQDISAQATLDKAVRLMARLPLVMCYRHRLRSGQEVVPPEPGQSVAWNILWMLRGQEPQPDHVRALDVTLILYVEHEFNASTFTARVVASTLSDLHSAVTAAIGALKGPLHGGANERVMDYLSKLSSAEEAETWVKQALERKERIMGFGHRVYRTGDPRAAILAPYCEQLARQTGNEAMEAVAGRIEQVVREQKNIPPNVDYPAGRLYYYLGLPVDLYTPLFVISRTVGWSAHVLEQQAANRLIRPRARYVGAEPRDYVPVEQRG